MIYIYSFLIIVLSALLWRIRGGLWKKYIPMNKIWYAVFFACYSCFYFSWGLENFIIGFTDSFTSYQLYGWGLYIGSLLTGVYALNPAVDKECELIDDLLYSIKITFSQTSAAVFNWFFGWLGWRVEAKTYHLYEFPKAFGFLGTTLTGFIITFLWGLFLGSLPVMLSGLGMGVCYWIGGKLEKLYPLGKNGWNWGEIVFGAYEGVFLACNLFIS